MTIKYKIVKPCKYCNEFFESVACKNRKYCSRLCFSKDLKSLYKGANNPFFGKKHNNKTKRAISDRSKNNIDYDKKNKEEVNLTTLCRKCHLKTNWNRDHWQDILSNKKGYLWQIGRI